MSRNTIITLAVAVGLVGGAVGAAVLFWPASPPDPTAQTPEEVTKYMASKDFAGLDAEQKRQYFQAARQTQTSQPWRRPSGDLSEEERKRFRENVRPMMQQMMEGRVTKYFELPPQERVGYLDEMIDQMQAMRQAMGQRRREPAARGGTSDSASGRRRGPHGQGFTPERMKRMIETTPPEQRARFVEFHEAFRARMQQRGISSGGPGRGGRPPAR